MLVTPNVDHVRLLRDPAFREAYYEATAAYADGLPIVLYARLRGLRLAGRLTGCDILSMVMRSADLLKHRLYVVVESEQTAEAARRWVEARDLSTSVEIAVAVSQLLMDRAGQEALASAITAHRTSLLVMTLGAPVSEVFVSRYREHLPACWALCVGQALRVELGLVERAPFGWRKWGLEWAWRIWQEPRRLGPRYLKAAVWFPCGIMLDMMARRR